MIDILQICKKVLNRLSKFDYESQGGNSSEQLIFPVKIQSKGVKIVNRISEQELRLLFIEEFKSEHPTLFYSIETPTTGKFSFGKCYEEFKVNMDGQSASHDMCIFDRINGKYERILNVEFKHRNSGIKISGKDILKLIHEKQNGVFIHLLENTNNGTLGSIFNKLYISFSKFQGCWNNENKFIELFILSLKQQKIIYCRIYKTDLKNLENIFSTKIELGSINNISGYNWNIKDIKQLDL